MTYGSSVQVKAREKPHDRTSDSASLRDFGLADISAELSCGCLRWLPIGKMGWVED